MMDSMAIGGPLYLYSNPTNWFPLKTKEVCVRRVLPSEIVFQPNLFSSSKIPHWVGNQDLGLNIPHSHEKGAKYLAFLRREEWRSRGFIRNKKVASLLTSFRGGRLLHRHVALEQNIRLRFPLNLNGERGDGMFLLLALNVIGVGQLPTKSRLRLPLFLNCWVKWLAFRADFSWVGLRRPSISIYWSRVDPPES